MEKNKIKKLIDENLTQREIADKLNISQTNVRHWLKKFNLSTNNGKQPRTKKHLCRKCGETNPTNFYGNDKAVCGKCHNNRVKKAAKEKRKYAIDELGGKCINPECNYDKFICSLDIHHIDPTKKDVNFKSLRGWSLERIDKEIKHCVILCKNCHSAYHAGELKLEMGS